MTQSLTIHLRSPEQKLFDVSIPASKVSSAWYVCRQSDVEAAAGQTRTEHRDIVSARLNPYAIYHACGLVLTWRQQKREAVALCHKLASIYDRTEPISSRDIQLQIIAAVQAA